MIRDERYQCLTLDSWKISQSCTFRDICQISCTYHFNKISLKYCYDQSWWRKAHTASGRSKWEANLVSGNTITARREHCAYNMHTIHTIYDTIPYAHNTHNIHNIHYNSIYTQYTHNVQYRHNTIQYTLNIHSIYIQYEGKIYRMQYNITKLSDCIAIKSLGIGNTVQRAYKQNTI